MTDPYAAILKEVRDRPGEWMLDHCGAIRHRELRARSGRRACPLCVATGSPASYENAGAGVFADIFGLPVPAIRAFMLAADDIASRNPALRRRLLEACKLEEPADA